MVRLLAERPARLGGTRLVAVDGPSGSGKTSLAQPLAAAVAGSIGAYVLQPDRYEGAKRQAAEQVPMRGASCTTAKGRPRVAVVSTDLLATWEHPLDWWPTLDRDLLAPLAAGETAVLPVIAWSSGHPRPGGFVVVPPVDVLVLEGVSSGRRAVADRLTVLAWVEVPDPAARLERAVARDGETMRRHLARWQRDETRHFQADRTVSRADVLIDPTRSG